MDLIAIAVPFFLLALLVELGVDRYRGTGYYRTTDAIGSLSAGILSTTFGYFTKLLPLIVWGFVLENFALIDMPLALFDLSPGGVLLWVTAALAWDFCYYWFHRFSHEWSILWAAHAVHHQSEDYNLSTALRQTSTGFLFGWIFYLPLFLLGFPLEVLVTVNAVNLIYQFWVHTRHIGSLGALDRWLVTPSNHRVHHARNTAYVDRNYGGMFIVWDRLFGTFEPERDEEEVVYGVRKPLNTFDPFRANLSVYGDLWFDSRHTADWRDKLKVWFSRTGWRPADVTRRYPERSATGDLSARYDPTLAPALKRYVLLQFAIAAAATLIIGVQAAGNGPLAVLAPCAALWITLYSLAGFSDGRRGAVTVERVRLVLVALAALYLYPGVPAMAGIAYAVVSWLGLELALNYLNNNNIEHKSTVSYD